VQQQLSVPAAPGPLTFRTWGNLEPVQVTVSAVTVATGMAHPLLAYSPPTLQGSMGSCSGLKPIPESLSLAAYAGQTIGLRLEATSSGTAGTIADFDDFALTGTAAPPPTSKCVVPKLRGLTVAAAKHKLTSAGCGVGKVKKHASSSVRKGRVISSSPGRGSQRSAGAKVALTVSSG
jgi:hypothetical protein